MRTHTVYAECGDMADATMWLNGLIGNTELVECATITRLISFQVFREPTFNHEGDFNGNTHEVMALVQIEENPC